MTSSDGLPEPVRRYLAHAVPSGEPGLPGAKLTVKRGPPQEDIQARAAPSTLDTDRAYPLPCGSWFELHDAQAS
jgi:hypothetical protein